MSDLPNTGPSNYKMLALSSTTVADSVFTMTFDLEDFVKSGILRTGGANPNRMMYLSAYGRSGEKNWYGTQQDPANPANLVIPGLNLRQGESANASLELELP
jgi:hypothetical protein